MQTRCLNLLLKLTSRYVGPWRTSYVKHALLTTFVLGDAPPAATPTAVRLRRATRRSEYFFITSLFFTAKPL
jgi:hypothetical protein